MAWHDKIKSLRKDEKLTQEELAKKLGVDRSTVAKLSAEQAGSSDSELARMKKSQRALSLKVEKALDLYIDGTITKELLDKKTNGLRAELDLLTERIIFLEATATKAVSVEIIKERLTSLIADLESLEFSRRKKVVTALLKSVYVFRDRVEAVFKIDANVCDGVGGGEPLLTIPKTATRAQVFKAGERDR